MLHRSVIYVLFISNERVYDSLGQQLGDDTLRMSIEIKISSSPRAVQYFIHGVAVLGQ